MRILIHDYAGHSFQVQLSRELARRGHEVLHLYAGNNNTPKGDLALHPADPKSFCVEGVYSRQRIQKYSFLRRWCQEIEYSHKLVRRTAQFKPEVVISGNAPIDTQNYLLHQCQKLNCDFFFWLQDVTGIATYEILKRKLPVLGDLIGRYYISLEKKILRASSRVILIADEFKPILENWGTPKENLTVIPNWATLEDLPVASKNNAWAAKSGLNNKFCFLYTGGMGLKHNPDLIVELAKHFHHRDDVAVVVVSAGRGADYLFEKQRELGLHNLILLGYQDYRLMPDVLASGDVLIAILEPDAGIFSVPSKVLSYLCAKRPLLLAVPEKNLAAKIVRDHHAGMVVEPTDYEKWICAADLLNESPQLRATFAANARKYAETYFNITDIADKFERIIVSSYQEGFFSKIPQISY